MSFRIPVSEEYCSLLGRAVYSFAYYEWIVIHTIEHFAPGYLREYIDAANRPYTSGAVANRFIKTINEGATVGRDISKALNNEADRFKRLVQVRNRLIHAHPYTAAGGAQQLTYQRPPSNVEWEGSDILKSIYQFEEGAIALNALFHGLNRG
jgi:hypothetical protein